MLNPSTISPLYEAGRRAAQQMFTLNRSEAAGGRSLAITTGGDLFTVAVGFINHMSYLNPSATHEPILPGCTATLADQARFLRDIATHLNAVAGEWEFSASAAGWDRISGPAILVTAQLSEPAPRLPETHGAQPGAPPLSANPDGGAPSSTQEPRNG